MKVVLFKTVSENLELMSLGYLLGLLCCSEHFILLNCVLRKKNSQV